MNPADSVDLSHPDVEPTKVFVIDQPAKKDERIDDHAISVAGIMIANGEALRRKGVSPEATLYSSAIETKTGLDKVGAGHQIAEQFVIAAQKISQPEDGKPKISAINVSWGIKDVLFPAESLPKLDGLSTAPLALDYLTTKRDVLFVKSAGNKGQGVNWPVDAYNALVVSGLEVTDVDKYTKVGRFSETSVGEGGRVLTQVVAPGELSVPQLKEGGAGQYTFGDGTSYAAPHVTGVVALLQQYVATPANNISADAKHNQVMKAVVINSAEKLKGKLGSDKTVLRKNGTDWTDSDARDVKGHEEQGQKLPLDNHIGAGAVDAQRAVDQLKQRVTRAGSATATKSVAWDYDTAARGNSDTPADFLYHLPNVTGGDYVSATLIWDREVKLTNSNGVAKEVYEGGKAAGAKDKFVAEPLANLDLYLVPASANGDVTKSVWESVSTNYNIEHIFFRVGAESQKYDLIVRQQSKSTSTPYALA